MRRLTLEQAREVFKTFADKDGWIDKTCEEITDEMMAGIHSPEYTQNLYTCMYFYDTEFKDETEKSWRFIETEA